MKMQKYLAEFLATFTLTLTVSLSLIFGLSLPTPVVAAVTVGIFVYTIGAISGAHINPAVTIALASIKKIKINEAVLYIVFQLLGAVLALFAVEIFAEGATELVPVDSWRVFVAEIIGAFLLVFGISSVVYERTPLAASGIVIGGSLLLGIMATGGISFGVLNPAVAIGLGSLSISYILAPIIGALLAAWTYRFLQD